MTYHGEYSDDTYLLYAVDLLKNKKELFILIGFYEKILPRLVNWCCSSNPVSKQREKIVPKASGIVLELAQEQA